MALGNRSNQHSFAQTPQVNVGRSTFDRSHSVKTTMMFDLLTPVLVDEIIPGDTINLNVNLFARLQPQVVPIMDNMYLDFHFFFVPNRLVWNNWEKFNGAQDDPGDSIDFLIPVVENVSALNGSIWDMMGILPGSYANVDFNALPLRAYNLIYNDWYRDQNLQNSLVVDKDDGPDDPLNYQLQGRGKRHDYFTSGLPWPQKGSAVNIPWGVTGGPVITNNTVPTFGGTTAVNRPLQINVSADFISSGGTSGATESVKFVNSGLMVGDLSGYTGTINQLREAFAIQNLLEINARGGTRYVEILQSVFGVVSPDFRLQRPEYLGGGSTRINSHPVAQTSPTSGANPLAQLGAFSTASSQGSNIGFTKSFVEHGYVIGICSARADITYQQGVNKMWFRQTLYDFYSPPLANLGEQTILLKELYITDVVATNDTVFGYQERWAEYRYKPSEIRGEFRSTYATSLDVWHLAQEFGSAPALNSTFITQNVPIERVVSVPSQAPLLLDLWFQMKHTRPMPTYSMPANLTRF